MPYAVNRAMPCRDRARYKTEDSARAQWKAARIGWTVERCPHCAGWHLIKKVAP